MATKFLNDGDTIQWTNDSGSAVASDDVVVIGGNGDAVLGVALVDLATTETGSVKVSGTWTLPKVSAAVILAGESLVWDSSVSEFDDNAATPASGDVSGAAAWAVEGAGNGATTVKVKLTGVVGTLTA